VHFLFAGVQTGGQMLGFQMGFSMMTFADPPSGQSIGITSHLLYMVTMMTFLGLNGHLIMLHGFAESFTLAPPGMLILRASLFEQILFFSGSMFTLAIKIAGPILCALFLVEVALGLMSRAAPQMHLIVIGLPIKIAVGFFFMGLLFTLLSLLVEDFIIDLQPMFNAILRSLGGG
jgi:flagellar biosynthetic protein FliR